MWAGICSLKDSHTAYLNARKHCLNLCKALKIYEEERPVTATYLLHAFKSSQRPYNEILLLSYVY